jgi:GT2 family glycosyltransferase
VKLLVVTPTLDRSPWLTETVASVTAVAPDAVHVLVAPPEVIPELERRFSHACVVREPEPGCGLYAAVNAGLAVPEWDFFTYLNDDDTLQPGFAQAVAVAREADASPGVIYGDVAYVDGAGGSLGRMPIAPPGWVGALLATGVAPFTQQGALVARAAWQRLGGFDERWRLAADFDFWCRAAATGVVFVRVRSLVATFRLHGGQLSADREVAESEVAAIRRHHQEALREKRRPWVPWLFRMASLGRLIERRRLAGVWTSRALYEQRARER